MLLFVQRPVCWSALWQQGGVEKQVYSSVLRPLRNTRKAKGNQGLRGFARMYAYIPVGTSFVRTQNRPICFTTSTNLSKATGLTTYAFTPRL